MQTIDYEYLLQDYDDTDYVYITRTCKLIYATKNKPYPYICEACGKEDLILAEGYVADLREQLVDQNKKITYKK